MSKIFVGCIFGGRGGEFFRLIEEPIDLPLDNVEDFQEAVEEYSDRNRSICLNMDEHYVEMLSALNGDKTNASWDVFGEGVVVMSQTNNPDKLELVARRLISNC